jgi:uncharacterized protein (TIGR02466 family)
MKHEITPLFAIPLYRACIESLSGIEDYISNIEYERMPAENGDYSKNKNILDEFTLLELKSQIQTHINFFAYEILDCKKSIEFQIQNSWVNRHIKNDFAGTHRHSNSLISGIYYISVNEKSGSIIFQKDKSYNNLWSEIVDIGFEYQDHSDQDKLNVFNSEGWAVTPKDGDILLFPSHLYHSVAENLSDRTRYSLAFNVFPRGTLGGTINTLRL